MSTTLPVTSRRRKRTIKPEKPYLEYPLYAHATGHWAKKIRKHVYYFGRWAQRERRNGQFVQLPNGGEWKIALAKYNAEIHDIQAGREPRVRAADSDGVLVSDLLNRFLTSKKRLTDSGELNSRTFREYKQATDCMSNAFGANWNIEQSTRNVKLCLSPFALKTNLMDLGLVAVPAAEPVNAER